MNRFIRAAIAAVAPLILVAQLGNADEKTDEVIKLVKQLRDKDEFVRLKAAKALGKLGADAKDALPALTDALKDEDADVRAVAKQAIATITEALDNTKRKDAMAELEKNLKAAKDADQDIRRKAAGGLAKALKDTDEIIRLKAAQGLAEMGVDGKGALSDLAAASKDTDEAVRKMARKASEKINAAVEAEKAEQLKETLAPLLKDLKDKDAKKRSAAAEKIAELGQDAKSASEPLVEAMMDTAVPVRNAAADALEKLNPTLHKHVVTILIGQNKDQALVAIKGMGAEGKPAMPAIGYLYQTCRKQPNSGGILYPDVFATVAAVGGDHKLVTAIFSDALTGSAPNENARGLFSYVRNEACLLVNKTAMDPKQKTAGLLVAIKDGQCTVNAAVALGEIGPDAKDAIPALKQLKSSTIDAVREAAKEALDKIDK